MARLTPARKASPAAKAKTARPGPGRPARGGAEVDVRERILDVAEAQFAKRGFEAVSTRAVAQDAGATAAMIHYYFNSKRALFDAVIARRADVVNRERMETLDAYDRKEKQPTVEGAVEAFMRPVLDKLASDDEGWRHYLALVAQIANTHEWGGEVMTNSFDPVVQRLIDIVGKALPDADPRELYWSYHFFSGALMLTLSETDRVTRLSKGLCNSRDVAAIEPRLIEFAAAGFQRVCAASRSTAPKANRSRSKSSKQ
jgi:AcrR family transcriptional regulator